MYAVPIIAFINWFAWFYETDGLVKAVVIAVLSIPLFRIACLSIVHSDEAKNAVEYLDSLNEENES